MTSLADIAAPGARRNGAPAALLPQVRIWLFVVAAFVLAMVVVGGATRLPARACRSPNGGRSLAPYRR